MAWIVLSIPPAAFTAGVEERAVVRKGKIRGMPVECMEGKEICCTFPKIPLKAPAA